MKRPSGKLLLPGTLIAAFVLALAAPAQAQQRWPGSIEGYLGAVYAGSDNSSAYRGSRGGILIDLLISGALHRAGEPGAVVALNAGMYGVNTVQTSDCVMRTPGGPCVPWFPGFAHASLLGGYETGDGGRRILGGAGIAGGEESPTLGLVGRADLALVSLSRVSAMATVNSLIVPAHRGDTFYYLGLGVGLRLR
jgi:hypothetical protein